MCEAHPGFDSMIFCFYEQYFIFSSRSLFSYEKVYVCWCQPCMQENHPSYWFFLECLQPFQTRQPAGCTQALFVEVQLQLIQAGLRCYNSDAVCILVKGIYTKPWGLSQQCIKKQNNSFSEARSCWRLEFRIILSHATLILKTSSFLMLPQSFTVIPHK